MTYSDAEELTEYQFPEHSVTIRAKNIEEAIKELNKLIKEENE
jgi:hypothetical protein